jgi:hypothetical protein
LKEEAEAQRLLNPGLVHPATSSLSFSVILQDHISQNTSLRGLSIRDLAKGRTGSVFSISETSSCSRSLCKRPQKGKEAWERGRFLVNCSKKNLFTRRIFFCFFSRTVNCDSSKNFFLTVSRYYDLFFCLFLIHIFLSTSIFFFVFLALLCSGVVFFFATVLVQFIICGPSRTIHSDRLRTTVKTSTPP